jgi:hypothetical protein
MGWFTSPDELKKQHELKMLLEEQERIELENTKIERLKENFPQVFDYLDKNIAGIEKTINYEIISQALEKSSKDSTNKNI